MTDEFEKVMKEDGSHYECGCGFTTQKDIADKPCPKCRKKNWIFVPTKKSMKRFSNALLGRK